MANLKNFSNHTVSLHSHEATPAHQNPSARHSIHSSTTTHSPPTEITLASWHARSRPIPRPLSLSDNVTWPEANGLLAAGEAEATSEGMGMRAGGMEGG